jgi:hypothetical protein
MALINDLLALAATTTAGFRQAGAGGAGPGGPGASEQRGRGAGENINLASLRHKAIPGSGPGMRAWRTSWAT